MKLLLNWYNVGAALLIVDVQNDFITGSLRVDKCPCKDSGEKVVQMINKLDFCHFNKIFLSIDWHPKNHISFYSNRFDWSISPKSMVSK